MTLHEFIIKNSVLLKKECVVKREIIFDEGGSEVRTVYSGKLKKIPISLTLSEIIDCNWSDDKKTLQILLTATPPKEEMIMKLRDMMYDNPEVYKLVKHYVEASDFGRDAMISAVLNGSLQM